MKIKFSIIASIFCLLFNLSLYAQSPPVVGYYITKEDYLNKKITVVQRMQESVNYNIGIIIYKDEHSVEHTENYIKEKYWGFRYLDGFDYMNTNNGFFAKIVIVGRIDLLISPKASFKIDEKGDFQFTSNSEGKINYYFLKDMDASRTESFEKLIADDKVLLKEYQNDKDNYGEFINKQLKYLKKYNEIVPKIKKGGKK
jgi:hypothetical protein